MLSNQELVDMFGEENIVYFNYHDALDIGLSELDALLLSHVGLPRQAGPVFTTGFDGNPQPFSVQRFVAPDGTNNTVLFLGAPQNEDLRFFLDAKEGHVVLCSLDEENPEAEIVNRSLSDFTHFIHEMTLRFTEEGLTATEEIEATEKLALNLEARDPSAFRDDQLYWPVTLTAMKEHARSLEQE
jgi:hypothetical protein